ncbi:MULTISPECIES: biotin transporter BioY [unclassified Sporolactobacillus]|uniref:biotin transporter BioY n=1 Tax=unclassified Sporolactobacillus TaxID=2628533 RepID=UPI0023680FA4|nr:biotin transporter BioY [Sporolactobacillus sp. CQH2019]MDD9150882.1 biotin transporter BioY [Sporolactobacillus sp. CQH2019]
MKTKELVEIALFAAILAVLGFLPPIPLPFTPVPITLQNLGVVLAGTFLGVRAAASSMILFVLLVGAGLPILGGGSGGIGAIVSPSGGFVLGWIVEAFVIALILSKIKKPGFWAIVLSGLFAGIIVLYPIGTLWQALMMHIPWGAALAMSAVYIPGDAIKTIAVAALAVKLRERVHLARRA